MYRNKNLDRVDERSKFYHDQSQQTQNKWIAGRGFVSGRQQDIERKQRDDIALLKQKGKNTIATQNAANKGSLDVTNARQSGATQRQGLVNKSNLDLTNIRQGGLNSRQNSINKLTKDQYGATNALAKDRLAAETSALSFSNQTARQQGDRTLDLEESKLGVLKNAETARSAETARARYDAALKDWTSDTYDEDGNLLSKARPAGAFNAAWRAREQNFKERDARPESPVNETKPGTTAPTPVKPTITHAPPASKKDAALRLGGGVAKAIPGVTLAKAGVQRGIKTGNYLKDKFKKSQVFSDVRTLTGKKKNLQQYTGR